MTRGDQILVAALLALALFSFLLIAALAPLDGDSVTIGGPEGVSDVSLRRTAVYRVEGRLGVVVVEVAEGRASVVDACCPDELCVRAGYARPGRPVVCAPNGVSVTVRGEGGEVLDAVSR
ncbi:MAG: NusG domain II-containing protein [Clostridiales bacterium]|nr:NusG domain II-containing protein [Clostridiales bacterium]